MDSYTKHDTCGNTVVANFVETHAERLIRHISREKRITPAHAKAVMHANGMLKEARDD